MIYIEDKIHITADQGKFLLTLHNERLPIFLDLDRILDYISYNVEKKKPIEKLFREMSGTYITVGQRVVIMEILKKKYGVEEFKFADRSTKSGFGMSADIVDSLLDDDTLSKEATMYIKLYKELEGYEGTISRLKKYARLPMSVATSFEGHRMVMARPEWKILNTNRISASEPSIQNIAKVLGDIITYPETHILVRADSGQIEPRITYSEYIKDPLIKALIILYNDAYYGILHYIGMNQADKTYFYSHLNELVKLDLPKNDRDILKLLSLAGNYGGGLANQDPVLASAFIAEIQQHPLRVNWEKEVRRQVRQGIETFYDAFGNGITPEDTDKYQKGKKGWEEHVVRCGINNRIQGTASMLMLESIYTANNIISEKAKYTTTINYYKHDEGAYLVHWRDSKLINELAECVSYQVRDWIPIYGEKFIGKKEGLVNVYTY